MLCDLPGVRSFFRVREKLCRTSRAFDDQRSVDRNVFVYSARSIDMNLRALLGRCGRSRLRDRRTACEAMSRWLPEIVVMDQASPAQAPHPRSPGIVGREEPDCRTKGHGNLKVASAKRNDSKASWRRKYDAVSARIRGRWRHFKARWRRSGRLCRYRRERALRRKIPVVRALQSNSRRGLVRVFGDVNSTGPGRPRICDDESAHDESDVFRAL